MSKAIRNLTCACCGESAPGRQWWNRDTGYGVCLRCANANTAKYGEGDEEDTRENPCASTTHALYGVRGYHFAPCPAFEGCGGDCLDCPHGGAPCDV